MAEIKFLEKRFEYTAGKERWFVRSCVEEVNRGNIKERSSPTNYRLRRKNVTTQLSARDRRGAAAESAVVKWCWMSG